MGLLTMFDATSVANIPAAAKYVALYVDGSFVNVTAGEARCPHATILTITVVPADVGECCDCEVGDLTVAQAETWVQWRLAANVWRPVVYANADRWENQGLLAGLAHYGNRIRRWVAAFPGTGANVPPGYDAHQYSSTDVDVSVCLSDFFDPPPPAGPGGKFVAEVQTNFATGQHRIRGLAGQGVRLGGPDRWASAKVTVDSETGRWDPVEPLDWNAPPLGG